MPGGDRRGPMGRGPGTGRGLGRCAGADQPGAAVREGGFGMGRGWRGGGRRGFRHRFWATGVPGWTRVDEAESETAPGEARETETESLRREVEMLREEIARFEARLKAKDEGGADEGSSDDEG